MLHSEYNSKNQTKHAHCQVSCPQKVIFASECVSSRHHYGLFTIKRLNWVIVCDVYIICAWFKVSIYFSPQFPELRQSGSPHPNYKSLILYVCPLNRPPVLCLSSCKLIFYITFPGDSFVAYNDLLRRILSIKK